MELEQESVSSLPLEKESVKPNSSTHSNTLYFEELGGPSPGFTLKKPLSDTYKLWPVFHYINQSIFQTPVAQRLRSKMRSSKSLGQTIVCYWMFSLGVLMSNLSWGTYGSWLLGAVVAWSFSITSLWPWVRLREMTNAEH